MNERDIFIDGTKKLRNDKLDIFYLMIISLYPLLLFENNFKF